MLSEARKYARSCVMSHQCLGQVPDPLRQAVFAAVGRFVSFKVARGDATPIAHEVGFRNPETLIGLQRIKAYVRDGLHARLVQIPLRIRCQSRLQRDPRPNCAAYGRP